MRKNSFAGGLFCLFTAFVVFPASLCFASISGTVTDTDGKTVSCALVTFVDELNPEYKFSDYSARAGEQYKYGTDNGTIITSKANYNESEIKHSADVGSYPANPFGLYDMSGNVYEYCSDWFQFEEYSSDSVINPSGPTNGCRRSIRSGDWRGKVALQRCSLRYGVLPDKADYTLGFRIVRRSGGVIH